MFHIEDGNKYIGEKFSIHKAVELCAKYKNVISSDITYCDIYLAINAHTMTILLYLRLGLMMI